MKLPNPNKAVIPQQKIQDYLLSQSHPIGRFKSIIFRDLGYTTDKWELLQSDFTDFLVKEASHKADTDYGRKYEIRGNITGPKGKTISIVTAWIVLNNEDFPRFITAYPGD